MRTLLLSLSFLILTDTNILAQTLSGYVTIQNSGKAIGKSKPKSAYPASVMAKGATDAEVHPDSGYFNLVFDDKKPGQDVAISVLKPDYEVVNTEALQARLPDTKAGAPPLSIYLCPKGQWRRYADAYYATNLRVVSDNYDRRIRAAEQKLAAAGNNSRALADSVNRLIRERDETLVLLKGYSEQLARVNLDEVTDRYRAAFRFFAEGKLDSFLLAANEKAIRADLARVEAEIKRAKALGQAGRDKVAAGEALRRQTLEELLIRARALILNGQWDEADRTLGIAAAEDSTNHKVQREYFNFKSTRLQLQDALKIAEKMLRLSKTPYDSLNWIQTIATTYMDLLEYDSAMEYLEMQMEVQKRNKSLIFKDYWLLQATCLHLMGKIYSAKGDFKKADQLIEEALSINERAARIHKKVAQDFFPEQLVDLGKFYLENANYGKAESTWLRAWEVKRNNVDTTTVEYQNWCAKLKGNLIGVYIHSSRGEQAVSLGQELVDYWTNRAAQDPNRYTIDQLYAIKDLISAIGLPGQLETAGRYLAIADSLLKHGPIPAGSEILRGDIMTLKIMNYVGLNRDLALSSAKEAIDYYRSLLQRDTLVFGDKLLLAYAQLMQFNSIWDRKEDNITLYQEYLALARSMQRIQPQKYTAPLAYALKIGGDGTWLPMGKNKPLLLEEAELLYQQLATENPDKYADDLAGFQKDIGSDAALRGDTATAIRYYEKAWAILSKYSENKRGLMGSEIELVGVLLGLGKLYFYNDPIRADSFFNQSLIYARKNMMIYQQSLISSLDAYGLFKANYGPLAEATALLEESSSMYQNYFKIAALNTNLLKSRIFLVLGNLYLLDNSPQKALAAHRKLVEFDKEDDPKTCAAKQQVKQMFDYMEQDNTDSVAICLDKILADTSFYDISMDAIYHIGSYLLAAGNTSKAKKCFKRLNVMYQLHGDDKGNSIYGKFHCHTMSALAAASAAQAAARQYAQTQQDTRRKEAFDLLEVAEKSLLKVPENTPGRTTVAAKIAEVRVELKM